MLSSVAKETGCYIIGGSIPESDSDGKLYNTSTSFGPDGAMLAKHRKVSTLAPSCCKIEKLVNHL